MMFTTIGKKILYEKYDLDSQLTDTELLSISEIVEWTIDNRYLFLYFPVKLEKLFERETRKSRAFYLIQAGIAAIITNWLFILADITMQPDIVLSVLILRLGVLTPIVLVIMLLLHFYEGLHPHLRESLQSIAIVLTAYTVIYLATISQSPYAFYYPFGLIVIAIIGNIGLQLRFFYACISSIAIFTLYILYFPEIGGIDWIMHINNIILLISTIGFTLFANYNRERVDRSIYLFLLTDRIQEVRLKASNLQLEELSYIDPLTGIPNRRSLDVYFDQLALEAPPFPIMVIMLDLDHFKLYNDHYGHAAGDDCLRRVGNALRNSLRHGGDTIARVGGEEFIVVLPHTHRSTACQIAERMVKAVRELAIPHTDSPVSSVVTISAGLASTVYTTPDDVSVVMQNADAAMYRAKSAGRNRVAI